jgi:two-component system, OmpR family, response regulator MtrA
MTTQRVLVVDDETDIRRLIRTLLERAGMRVTEASSGMDALRRLQVEHVDAVVLDVTMPGLNGWQTLERIRDLGDMPVLMLTARLGELNAVRGLRAGADDYVTKPFEMRELVARMRSLLRRAQADDDTPQILRVGPIEIRPDEGIVKKNDEPLSLTRTEFRLLTTLAARAGRVFSREKLLSDVWGYDYFGDARLVDVHVRRLRMKVEDDPHNPTIIQTVRGMGYKVAEE